MMTPEFTIITQSPRLRAKYEKTILGIIRRKASAGTVMYEGPARTLLPISSYHGNFVRIRTNSREEVMEVVPANSYEISYHFAGRTQTGILKIFGRGDTNTQRCLTFLVLFQLQKTKAPRANFLYWIPKFSKVILLASGYR